MEIIPNIPEVDRSHVEMMLNTHRARPFARGHDTEHPEGRSFAHRGDGERVESRSFACGGVQPFPCAGDAGGVEDCGAGCGASLTRAISKAPRLPSPVRVRALLFAPDPERARARVGTFFVNASPAPTESRFFRKHC